MRRSTIDDGWNIHEALELFDSAPIARIGASLRSAMICAPGYRLRTAVRRKHRETLEAMLVRCAREHVRARARRTN